MEILKRSSGITLAIYGPVKDVAYWRKCKKLIDQIPAKATYNGEILPEKVQDTFAQYDASILLSKGENFGHAIYESLSAGRPVITSHFTPWINLQQEKAGWNIDISNRDKGELLFNELRDMPAEVFDQFCFGAHEMALKYFSQLNTVEEYSKVF